MKTHPQADLLTWFDELIDNLILYETWSLDMLLGKLAEETGEVAEQVFVHKGMKNKVLDEPIEQETADVINCAIAIAVKALVEQGYAPDEIKSKIYAGIWVKNLKYLRLLTPDNPKKQPQ